MNPREQLRCELKYGVATVCTPIRCKPVPRPPGHRELTMDGFTNVRYATIMACRVAPQPVRKALHVLHAQVLVSPQQGPVMEPTMGF